MRNTLIAYLGAALICAASAEAATFSISPSTAAADYAGDVTLLIGGLSAGQSVLIEAFGDDNANGAVDSSEQLVMSLWVTDGERPNFPPSTTRLGPGDDDGATNSAVSKVLRLPLLAERLQLTGSYVFRVSGTGFSAIARPFTITAGSQAQAVTGTITSNGSPVAGAFAILLGAGEGDDSDFVGGAVANASGQFTVRADVGNYNLIALKPGYVAEFASAPMVSLVAGVTTTQSVTLVSASRTISGVVVDAVTSNGIGGIQLFAQSQQGAVTIGFSDASGNFTLPVTSGMWEIDVSENSSALPGYGHAKATVDATASNVTGVRIALSRALGEFELVFFFPSGGFSGGTNGSISFPTRTDYYYALYNLEDSNVPTNVFFSGPSGSGLNNTPSANFGASFGGDSAFYSSPQIAVPPYPPSGPYTVNYKGSPQTFVLDDPDAANRQIVLVPTAFLSPGGQLQELRWTYRNTSGAAIATPTFIQTVELRVDGIGGRLYDAEVAPDQTSHSVTSPVTWNDVSDIQMVYNDDRGNQYVSFWNRATQPLQILSQTLPRGRVGSAYQYLFVAAGGFSPYNWSFVSGNLPQGVTFTPVTGELTGTPQAGGTFNFRVRVRDNASTTIEKDVILNVDSETTGPRLEPGFRLPGQFGLRLTGEVGRTYSLQYSTTLANWTTLLSTNLGAASADLTDTSATNTFRFYRITSP
jgi:hypothetical protein